MRESECMFVCVFQKSRFKNGASVAEVGLVSSHFFRFSVFWKTVLSAADGIYPLLVPVGGGHRLWVCPAHSRACVCVYTHSLVCASHGAMFLSVSASCIY